MYIAIENINSSSFSPDYASQNNAYYKHTIRSKTMYKINITKIIKITLGCCLAFITATALHLEHSTSVVTITLLSILNTKKDTLIVAWKRSIAFLLSTSSAIISFTLFQFSVLGLGAYLIIIVTLCQIFELTDGLSMSTVLMLHIWTARSITASSLLNEAALMTIGILMGILMNLYMPSQIKKIKTYQSIIDRHFKELLLYFSDSIVLSNRSQSIQQQFDVLSPIFQKSIQATDLHVNNHLFSDTNYYLHYLKMRLKQYEILRIIAANIQRMEYIPVQAKAVSQYLKEVANSIEKHDNAQKMLDKLQKMRIQFRMGELPKNRKEFEARAILYEIVNDVQYLLRLKQEFAESLSPYQIKTFWLKKRK